MIQTLEGDLIGGGKEAWPELGGNCRARWHGRTTLAEFKGVGELILRRLPRLLLGKMIKPRQSRIFA